PSAAPMHTASESPRTGLIAETLSRAVTSASSVVPGFAKQISAPALAAVRRRASAPFISVPVRETPDARRQADSAKVRGRPASLIFRRASVPAEVPAFGDAGAAGARFPGGVGHGW